MQNVSVVSPPVYENSKKKNRESMAGPRLSSQPEIDFLAILSLTIFLLELSSIIEIAAN